MVAASSNKWLKSQFPDNLSFLNKQKFIRSVVIYQVKQNGNVICTLSQEGIVFNNGNIQNSGVVKIIV